MARAVFALVCALTALAAPRTAGAQDAPPARAPAVTAGATVPTVTLDDARRVIAAAERKATEIGQPMNIAVVDAGGNLVAQVRMDRAWLGSIAIATDKAFTARAFDMTTAELGQQSQSGQPLFGIHTTNDGRIIIFPGGIPLKRGATVVGAIGVSGGKPEQDQQVAEAGAAGL